MHYYVKKIKNEHLIEYWSFDLKMPIFGQRDSKKGIREIYTKEYFAVMIVHAAFFCIHLDASSVEIVTDRALAKSEKFFLLSGHILKKLHLYMNRY